MQRLLRCLSAVAFMASMFLLSSGCAGGKVLGTQAVRGDNITGNFTLILYQDGSYDRLKTIAFLIAEDSGYSFVPNEPPIEYSIRDGVNGQDALAVAHAFVSKNRSYINSVVSSIVDPTGKIIGYEVRPLYEPLTYGVTDVMRVSYVLKEGRTVRIDIDLLQSVVNRFLSDN